MSVVTAHEILTRAKELISQGWTQKDNRQAEDRFGFIRSCTSAEAVKWSLMGAINRAVVETYSEFGLSYYILAPVQVAVSLKLGNHPLIKYDASSLDTLSYEDIINFNARAKSVNEILEILDDALNVENLIIHTTISYIEKGWTQGAFALSSFREPVEPNSPKAVCWCVYGGMMRASSDIGLSQSDRCKAIAEIERRVYDTSDVDSLVNYNDDLDVSLTDVIFVLRKARNA